MSENKAFEETKDQLTELPKLCDVAFLQGKMNQSDRVRWWYKADPEVRYDPFLVFIRDIQPTKLSYSFVNCADGTPDADVFEVERKKLEVAHLGSPSTKRDTFDPILNPGVAIGFVMLHPPAMPVKAREKAGLMKQPATQAGKWPNTARAEAKLSDARQLVADMLALLSNPIIPGPLLPPILEAFRQRAAQL